MFPKNAGRAAWLGAWVVGSAVALSGTARADDDVIEGKLRACMADGVAIGGVAACAQAWKLRSGEVELERDGELEAEIKGLVLNDTAAGDANGTPGAVTHVVVSLVCGGQVAADSERVALSKAGNASIESRLAMPARCLAPALIVRDASSQGKPGNWLAVTGF